MERLTRQWSAQTAAGRQPFDGPLSQTLQCAPKGTFSLTSEDGAVLDLELRMRCVASNATLGQIPLLELALEYGHGDASFSAVASPLPVISGAPPQPIAIPARGYVQRLSARWVRVQVLAAGILGGAPGGDAATVRVSVQPVLASQLAPIVYQQPVRGLTAYPMAAREWRIRDFSGQPFAAAAVTLAPLGLSGNLLPLIDAALLADWTPIPFYAWAFNTSLPDAAFVEFR